MITSKHIRSFFLSFLLLAFSCQKENIGIHAPDNIPEKESEIRFEPALPQTRVATDMNLVSTWEEGDEIGIFAVKTPLGIPGHLQATGNYLHNIKLTYQNGTWISGATVYYPNDGEILYFYAYYPYDAALTDPTAYDFSVATNQHSDNYNTSDFLVAKTGVTEKSDHPVLLAFEHQWAMIQVEVLKEVNMPHLDGDFTVTLTSVQTGAKVDFNNPSGEYDLQGSRENIRMHKVSGSGYLYRAVVPAQILAGNTKVTFKQTTSGKVIDMEYTGLANKTLTAGEAHKYKLTLSWYGIDPDHVYNVGDVYPHAGPVMGIVYEVSNGGKNGKVFSLDAFWGLWSVAYWNMDAMKDHNNGINNMYGLAEYIRTNPDKNWSDFPAFEWVHAKNATNEEYTDEHATGVWYLPAKNEGEKLGNIYREYGSFNTKLSAAGGTLFVNDVNEWHWTSTQSTTTDGFIWNPHNPVSGSYNFKNTIYSVRCILTF